MLKDELKNIQSAPRDLRNFGLVVGGVLVAIALVLWWRERAVYVWVGGIGGALMALGLVAPSVLKPLQVPWMALAVVMGHFMSRVILFILYYVGITPIALLARIVGKDFLDTRWPDRLGRKSYWITREPQVKDPKEYERLF